MHTEVGAKAIQIRRNGGLRTSHLENFLADGPEITVLSSNYEHGDTKTILNLNRLFRRLDVDFLFGKSVVHAREIEVERPATFGGIDIKELFQNIRVRIVIVDFKPIIALFVARFFEGHGVDPHDVRVFERHGLFQLLVVIHKDIATGVANAGRDVVLESAPIAAFKTKTKAAFFYLLRHRILKCTFAFSAKMLF